MPDRIIEINSEFARQVAAAFLIDSDPEDEMDEELEEVGVEILQSLVATSVRVWGKTGEDYLDLARIMVEATGAYALSFETRKTIYPPHDTHYPEYVTRVMEVDPDGNYSEFFQDYDESLGLLTAKSYPSVAGQDGIQLTPSEVVEEIKFIGTFIRDVQQAILPKGIKLDV